MSRDAFGGPRACHIRHGRNASAYLGPVIGTAVPARRVIDQAPGADR